MAEKSEKMNEITTRNSILGDLKVIIEKMKGPSKELLEEMIITAERNPNDQTRAIERLLQEKIHSIDTIQEEVDE